MGREPDLTKLAKKLTSKQLACTEEIKLLMDCMMVRVGVGGDAGGPCVLTHVAKPGRQHSRQARVCRWL